MLKRVLKNITNIKKLAIFLIFLGLFILFLDLYLDYLNISRKELLIEAFFQSYIVKPEMVEKKTKKNKIFPSTSKNNYFLVLEIPIINLLQGLMPSDSPQNNINQNIEIINNANITSRNTNLVLAAHSGTSKVSYFNKLYLLNINDDIFLYYNTKKYSYKVIKKYQIEKTGKFLIPYKENETLLTLITCTLKNNKQLVIIAQQIK